MNSAICDLSFDSFQIANTRARHTDTDFVTFSVTVGGKGSLTAVKCGSLLAATTPETNSGVVFTPA